MLPKSEQALENALGQCEDDGAFVKIPKESHIDFVKEAYSDLASAEDEFGKSDKWAIVKAYQALFSMCNALLIRKRGCYSKDHGCVLLALMKERVIPETLLGRIKGVLHGEEGLFDKISGIRITRNKYLYFPETQRRVKASPNAVVDEVRAIMQVLAGVE